MATGQAWFKVPETIRVLLTGKKPANINGKDVILTLIGRIGVDGALYKSLEFAGEGVAELSMYKERYIACEFDYQMDFVAYAKSFGIAAEAVSTPEEFAAAFGKAMAATGPRVIVLNIHRSFVEPMVC